MLGAYKGKHQDRELVAGEEL